MARLILLALPIALTAVVSADSGQAVDVGGLLHRAGERVTEFFARAQSLMCLEKVSLQRLSSGLASDGPSRFVESELRVSWDPSPDDPTPKEAKTLRQVLRVNGSPPRKRDMNNCTTPEQQVSETQPLSILLPALRGEYTFKFDRLDTVDGRSAIVLSYREVKKPTVEVSLVDGKEDCINFEIDGGMRGRVWIDAETHDVLRLDKTLIGLVDIPLPWKVVRRGGPMQWTMERWDESIRFKRVTFQDPEETMILPVSSTALQITRGAGTPRLRTTTQYLAYRRFLTGGRLVPPPQ